MTDQAVLLLRNQLRGASFFLSFFCFVCLSVSLSLLDDDDDDDDDYDVDDDFCEESDEGRLQHFVLTFSSFSSDEYYYYYECEK